MQISFCNGNDKEYQRKLNHLLKDIFFDFTFWYDLNLWDQNYESYSIEKDNQIISNICIFKTQMFFRGKQYPALSIGAVATKSEYRGKGFSRMLMEHIIKKHDDLPMYLSANENVIDFYPKFGFKRVYEKLPVSAYAIHNDIASKPLRFDSEKLRHYIYNRQNIHQSLDCLNAASINLFHIFYGNLKTHIYDIPELETIVIAKQNGTTLNLIGVFSLKEIAFADLAKHLPFANIQKIEFGFMPYWDDLQYEMIEYNADPFFVRGGTCEIGDFKFPELALT